MAIYHDLDNTGQEVQQRLDQVPVTQADLAEEVLARQAAVGAVQDNVDAEELRAKAAEKLNADDIDAIEEKIPSGASSSNKMATASDISSLDAAIEAILLLIPSAATSLNKLADKAFVNSSIATATATFRGTKNLVSDLNLAVDATHEQIVVALSEAVPGADNNDYAFVQVPTSSGTPTEIRVTERYKFDGTAWSYEYDLNNSGFTSDQWAAINSTITSGLVDKLNALPSNADLTAALGILTNGIAAINEKIPTAATSSNKLVDTAAMQSYITQILDGIDATFNVTSTDGHVTIQVTQVNGVVTNVAVTTSDIASAADVAQLFQLYNALSQSEPEIIQPADTWPLANPSTTVIYRVIDRVNTPPQNYSDYMFSASDLTTPVLMATYNNAIDPRPKKGSQNLVTSGGVFDNMGALDVSELNATENPHTPAIYADLSAALAAITSDYQKGGMSIKFVQGSVQSNDNKYVQYRLRSNSFSVNVNDWENRIDGILLYSYNSSDLTERGHYVSDNDVLGEFVSNNNESTKIFDIPNGSYLLKYRNYSTSISTDRGIFFIDSSNNILARRLLFNADNSMLVPEKATKVLFCIIRGDKFNASFYSFKQTFSIFFDSRNYYDFSRIGYYDESGNWNSNNSRRTIYEKIPVGTKKIYFRDIINNNNDHFGIRLFDGNGNVLYYESMSRTTFRSVGLKAFPTATHYALGVVTLGSSELISLSSTIKNPYILFSSEDTIDEDAMKFSGKSIMIFGDSISNTADPKGISYPEYLASFCGANVINCAISGSHLSDKLIGNPGEYTYNMSKLSVVSMIRAFNTQNFTSVDEAAAALDNEGINTAIANLKSVNRNNHVDYAIIMAGTNDYNATPSGERGTTDTGTIYGSIAYIATNLTNWVYQILFLSNIVTWFDISNNKQYDFSDVRPSSYISNNNQNFSRFALENRATAFRTFRYGVPNNGILIYAITNWVVMFELSSISFRVFDTTKFANDGNHYFPMAFEYNRSESGNYIFSKVITNNRDNNSNPSSENPLFKNNTDYLLVANVEDKYYMMCYWDDGRYTAKEVSVVNDEITLTSLETSFKHTWSTELFGSRFSQNNEENLYTAHMYGRTKYELNDVIEQAAKDYNMPFGDMYYSLGWNFTNFKRVCSDGFHPGLSDGIKTIATRVLSYMKELFH